MKAECYGYEIHKRLASQGIQIDIGRLYNVLADMLTEGLLVCRWEKSAKGPQKRVYRLSEKGKKELDKILQDAIDTVHAYHAEYLLSLPSSSKAFEDFALMVAPEVKAYYRMAFFAQGFSIVDERILAVIKGRLTGSEIYVVCPKGVNLNLNVENVIFLHGEYESIPLKEKYVDLLIIEDLPSRQNLWKAAREWYRVTKEDGRLVLIAPTTFFCTFKDPLSIGDFVEKMKLQDHGGEPGKGETLMRILGKHFRKVEKRQMLQMTCLVACKL